MRHAGHAIAATVPGGRVHGARAHICAGTDATMEAHRDSDRTPPFRSSSMSVQMPACAVKLGCWPHVFEPRKADCAGHLLVLGFAVCRREAPGTVMRVPLNGGPIPILWVLDAAAGPSGRRRRSHWGSCERPSRISAASLSLEELARLGMQRPKSCISNA